MMVGVFDMKKAILLLSSLLLLTGCNKVATNVEGQTSATTIYGETSDITNFEVPHREVKSFPSLEGYDYSPIPAALTTLN